MRMQVIECEYTPPTMGKYTTILMHATKKEGSSESQFFPTTTHNKCNDLWLRFKT